MVAAVSGIFANMPTARADEVATAEALFEAGRKSVARSDYDAACAQFAESERLDPAAGTLLNLADCEEHLGHLAHAWDAWHEGIALLPRGDDRIAPARERARALEGRLPLLIVRLSPDSPTTARVIRDDTPLGPASLGVPLPVDPGTHVVRVEDPGHAPSSTEVKLAEGEARTIDVGPGPLLQAASVESTVVTKVDGPSVGDESAHRRSVLREAGWIAGKVGIAGLAIGVITGILTMKEKSTTDANCIRGNLCNPTGYNAAKTGQTLAIATDVSFALGAVLAVGGIALVIAEGPAPPTVVEVQPSPGGAAVGVRRSF